MASHKIEAYSVNGTHRLRLSPLVKQSPLASPVAPVVAPVAAPVSAPEEDLFDEEDDELLKALFREVPKMENPHVRVERGEESLLVVIRSDKLIRRPSPKKPPPPVAPTPKVRRKMRPKHSHNRHMIHTMPTQPDYVDFGEPADDEIVEALVSLTLMDPVSGTRMVTPLRSRHCSHNECFDYDAFLLMNHLKPFKVVVRRYSNATRYPGEVNVMAILQDSKRPPKSSKEFNKVTTQYDYKYGMRKLMDRSKQYNELGFFCCPICNLEFNINQPGDVYVVGELADLIQDVSLEEKPEEIESIEIDMIDKGKWRWVRRENERKEHIERQIESHQIELVTLDSEDEDFDKSVLETSMPVAASTEAPHPPPQQAAAAAAPPPPPPPPVLPPLAPEPGLDIDAAVDDFLNLGEYDAEPGVFMGDFPLPASPDAAETRRVDATNYSAAVVAFKPAPFTPPSQQGDECDPIVLD